MVTIKAVRCACESFICISSLNQLSRLGQNNPGRAIGRWYCLRFSRRMHPPRLPRVYIRPTLDVDRNEETFRAHTRYEGIADTIVQLFCFSHVWPNGTSLKDGYRCGTVEGQTMSEADAKLHQEEQREQALRPRAEVRRLFLLTIFIAAITVLVLALLAVLHAQE